MPSTNEKGRGIVPAANERASLVTALVAKGYKGTDLADVIKAGLTRKEIADKVVAIQRKAKKG